MEAMQQQNPSDTQRIPLRSAGAPLHEVPPSPPPVALSAPSTSKTTVRVALGVGVLLVLGLAGFTGIRVKQALAKRESVAAARVEAQAEAEKKPPSAAVHPTATTWRPHVELTGTLKPWREAEIGFETTGRLVKVQVAAGESVKQGQLLAVLDSQRAGELVGIKDASMRAAAANVAMAEDAARRAEALAKTNAIPEAQLEQARQSLALAKAQMAAAQGDLQMARTGVGLYSIVAPFAGMVTKAPTSGGGVVAPGAPLVRVEDLSRFRLSVTVSEDDVPLVHVGAEATIHYRERTVKGRVTALVPSLDPGTRRAPAEIEVPNDANAPLLGYGFVRAELAGDRDVPAVKVPSTARRPGSQDEVVVVEHGVAKLVHVLHAVGADGSWIVRQGLSADSIVLVSPSSEIKDGDPVVIEMK